LKLYNWQLNLSSDWKVKGKANEYLCCVESFGIAGENCALLRRYWLGGSAA
jgi:hypothetical protein